MAYTPEVAQKLAEKTDIVRRNVFRIFQSASMGHAGGTMSLLEIVTALYFHHLKLDPKNCDWPERDRVILSKAHAAEAIYAVLTEIGYVNESMLDKYYCYGSQFQGHADRWCTPGIDYSGGSLGQGLSFAAGLAMAEKINTAMHPPKLPIGSAHFPRLEMKYNPAYRVFCIVGDGECAEGNIWEGAMFAGKYKLDNLINIVDYNKFCIDGPTEDIIPLAPIDEKFKSFGWWVKEIDGHNMREVVDTLELANNLYGDGKPKCIIAHTVKGHGIPSWENAHIHYGRGDGMSVGLKEGGKLYGKV